MIRSALYISKAVQSLELYSCISNMASTMLLYIISSAERFVIPSLLCPRSQPCKLLKPKF